MPFSKNFKKVILPMIHKQNEFNKFVKSVRQKNAARGKTGGSTKTKTKLNQKANKTATHHWISYGAGLKHKGKPLPKALSKINAPNTNYVNSVVRIPVPIGQQSAFNLASAYTPYDIAIFNPGVNATFIKNSRVFLESCSQKILSTNMTNVNVFMDLYDVECRRDYLNTADPPSVWSTGLVDQNNAALISDVGSTPFASQLFTQLFKVKRITRVILSAGETHEHITYHKADWLWNHEVDGNPAVAAVNGQQGYKGLTNYTFAVSYGAPVNDSTTKTQISTSAAAIDCVITKQYRYSYMSSNSSNVQVVTNTLPTAFTVAGEVEGQETDTVQAIVSA
jgi:hypothetical protein